MRKILLSLFSICSFLLVRSQDFTLSAGISFMVQPTFEHDLNSAGITYFLRRNFVQNKNSSFSIGVPISFGWSDLKKIHFAVVDIPVEIDYNFGAGSTKNNKKRFGYFFGAGYGLHLTITHFYPRWAPVCLPGYGSCSIFNGYYNFNEYQNFAKPCIGPTLNAGFRLAVGNKGKIVELRFTYMKVLDVYDRPPSSWLYNYQFHLLYTSILGAGIFITF